MKRRRLQKDQRANSYQQHLDHCKRRGIAFPSLTKSNLMKARVFHHDASEIDWYCELRGDGPSVVLMPSGEGDCASFQTVADVLSDEFTILRSHAGLTSTSRACRANIFHRSRSQTC